MWFWNKLQAAYEWIAGKVKSFLSRETIARYQGATIDATGGVTDTLAELVAGGWLSPQDWREMMRRHIKAEHIRQGVLAAGGRENMNPRRWGIVGATIKDQYKYIDGFTDRIAADEYSEAQIKSYSRMYIDAAREAFERINQDVHIEAGYDEVLWVVDEAAENCDDCLAFASMGWQKIDDDPYGGCFPGSACTKCLTRCRCHLEYRKSEGAKAKEKE